MSVRFHRFRQKCYFGRTTSMDEIIPRRKALFGLAGIPFGLRAQPHTHLAHDNLMLYRDAHNSIQPVTTVDQWLLRRGEILRAMQQVMGPLPGPQKKTPLDMRVE